ncbi:hypothetical protein [Methylobacterium sp. PvR107]|uniref:hypothetical protein n=1 Tax=Methylobacterium sp. PvR107 TaxID=2806597 RepID=UPI001AE7F50D|nr:hypothetical protein [Methylobacterium sp. PvR107]MBP1181626.1 hypothetical protein [Methylobacterium sp. PvR107]
MLDNEARALLVRLGRIRPFVLNQPMVMAASLLPRAQLAIERFLARGRAELKGQIHSFIRWLHGPGASATAAEAQQKFVFLRLRFNAILTQLELFNQVITQRSESDQGVWLSGLDVVSSDALALPTYYKAPPIICYLDRGIGAAIRRARTRLPGGGRNPVAIIRVPRERMIGSGIASSLFHEVGHQGAQLLGLVESLRRALRESQARAADPLTWQLWQRWISEIVSDFWSVARVGVASTLGLMSVVGLPRPFVFRINIDDPHPVPWIRVKVSCAIGDALNPHEQWSRLARTWEKYYPLDRLDPSRRRLILRLERNIPDLVALLVRHRPPSLHGRSLSEALEVRDRSPDRLSALFRVWSQAPADMYRAPPSLAFAVIGQAKANGRLGPEGESELLAKLLTFWAMRSTLDAAAASTPLPAPPARHALVPSF